MRRTNVVNEYNKLLRKQQAIKDKMSNLQREKDYRVQKIEKKYESQIEDCIRAEEAIAMQINMAKQYIADCKQAKKKEG